MHTLTSIALALLGFGVLLVLGLACKKQSPAASASGSAAGALSLDATPDKPEGFGYKNAWLAVKADDPQAVARVLELEDLQPANWRTGLAAAYDHYDTHVFVTPSVSGWVLVVGMALPDSGEPGWADKCTPLLEKLGRKYDPAFYFGTHRVAEYHAWARVDQGRITRAYAYSGDKGITIWNEGPQTKAERDLHLDFFADDAPPGQSHEYYDRKDLRYPQEDDVINLAGAWSINPARLEDMNLPPSSGFVARVPQTWR